MLEEVYAAVHAGRNAEARALLEADPVLLASVSGRHALGYVLAHGGEFGAAREVYRELWTGHRGRPAEHIFVHQLGMVERLAGNHTAALELFGREHALIAELPEDGRALKRAVNGYEFGVCYLALGETGPARRALVAALVDAQTARDPMTLGCVRRALGDLAAATGELDTARQEYTWALEAFARAGDEGAAAEVRDRRDAL